MSDLTPFHGIKSQVNKLAFAIPDPGISDLGSRIPDAKTATTDRGEKIFNLKNMGLGSGIRNRFFRIPDPGVKKAPDPDPDPQHCIFFLLPTASSFLITSLSGWGGGDAHGQGGGCTGGEGGMHVHPVHPPWVRHCPKVPTLKQLFVS